MVAQMIITVVGNCQARPFGAILEELHSRFFVKHVVVVHLSGESDRVRAEHAYAESDIIFTQLVASNYQNAHVTTDYIRNLYPNKVVTWPNIFFRGQSLDICYATTQKGTRVVGPLGEYQHKTILTCWRNFRNEDETYDLLMSGEGWAHMLHHDSQTSLCDLRQREAACDIVVSDLVESLWRDERMFFTFNHPYMFVIKRVVTRALRFLSLDPQVDLNLNGPEPLDRIKPLLLPIIVTELGMNISPDLKTQGCDVNVESRVTFGTKRVQYDLKDLISATFMCLERQICRDESLRIS